MNNNERDAHDLRHFLNLAGQQLRFKMKQAEAEKQNPQAIDRMRLLEDLIKEQVPPKQVASAKP